MIALLALGWMAASAADPPDAADAADAADADRPDREWLSISAGSTRYYSHDPYMESYRIAPDMELSAGWAGRHGLGITGHLWVQAPWKERGHTFDGGVTSIAPIERHLVAASFVGGRFERPGPGPGYGRQVRLGAEVLLGVGVRHDIARSFAARPDLGPSGVEVVPVDARSSVVPMVGASADVLLPITAGVGIRLSVQPACMPYLGGTLTHGGTVEDDSTVVLRGMAGVTFERRRVRARRGSADPHTPEPPAPVSRAFVDPSDPWERPVEAYHPELARSALAVSLGANVKKDGILDDHYLNGGVAASRVWGHGFGLVARLQVNPVAHSRLMLWPGYTYTDSLGLLQTGLRYELDGGQGRYTRNVRLGFDLTGGLALARVRGEDLDHVPAGATPFVHYAVGAAVDLDLPVRPGVGLRLSVQPFHSFGRNRIHVDPGIRMYPRDRTGVRVMLGVWLSRQKRTESEAEEPGTAP